MNNQYQDIVEPSGKETWYSDYISQAVSPKRSSSTLNRYKNKITLTTISGITSYEFIRKSQLYIEPHDDDQFYFVDASKRYRPDIISNEMYGTPILYWVILSCNNLSSPLQVETNMTLRIPQLTTLFNEEKVI